MTSNATLSPFYRGDTKTLRFAFTDTEGHPVDITGHELWFTLKRDLADLDDQAVLQKRVAMVFQLVLAAERKWRRLNAPKRIAQVIDGIKFINGEEEKKLAA